MTIYGEIKKGERAQGAEIRPEDVGKDFGDSMGRVLLIDVGKRVWLKPYGLAMENNEQRDKRKAKPC